VAQVLLDLDDRSKDVISPNEMQVLFNFCSINFLPSHTVEAAEQLQPHFAHTHTHTRPDPQIRLKVISRRLKPKKVDDWEGAQLLWFYKLYLKMINHSSRSTWGRGPSLVTAIMLSSTLN
jgi:hypothetical protein